MLDVGKQVALCHAVASQLVGHDHPRHIVQSLQQAPEEALGGIGISALLNEDVEHNAVLIHGAPKIVLHALDPDEHLVQVPPVPGPWPAAAQAVGKAPAELLAPAPNSLIGDNTPRSARLLPNRWVLVQAPDHVTNRPRVRAVSGRQPNGNAL